MSDLCEENAHLADLYEEIRASPMVAEMKEEYESTIRNLEDQVASLKSNYDKLYEDNLLLREDYESLQRTFFSLLAFIVDTTVSATSPSRTWRPARVAARRWRRTAMLRRRRRIVSANRTASWRRSSARSGRSFATPI